MHCCNINKSRMGGFFLVHLVYSHTEIHFGEISEKPYIIVLQVENASMDLIPNSNRVHYRKALPCQRFRIFCKIILFTDRQTDGRTDGLKNRQSDRYIFIELKTHTIRWTTSSESQRLYYDYVMRCSVPQKYCCIHLTLK